MTKKTLLIAAIIVIGALIAGLLIYLSRMDAEQRAAPRQVEIPEPEPEPVPAPGETEPVPAEPARPAAPEAPGQPAFVLPRLEQSDPLVRDGVASLTRDDGIETWVDRQDLVRRFVVVVDGLANGNVVRKPIENLTPRDPFTANPIDEEVFVLDEGSYRRFDRITEILVSIDTRRAAELYGLLRPLFQEAYGELGYARRSFDDTVFRAIGRLLETPVITGPIYLVQPGVLYEYQDPKLESLSPAQKQLIRMGPRNTRAIQAKLSDMALELRSILEER